LRSACSLNDKGVPHCEEEISGLHCIDWTRATPSTPDGSWLANQARPKDPELICSKEIPMGLVGQCLR
jgi:hypothetical protein